MKLLFLVLALVASAVSAFEISALSRRAVARAFAFSPFVATAAFADAGNAFLGKAKSPTDSLSFDTVSSERANLGEGLTAIGRNAAVDDAGAAVPLNKNPPGMPSKAQFTASQAANFVGPPGSELTVAQKNAMARLMK